MLLRMHEGRRSADVGRCFCTCTKGGAMLVWVHAHTQVQTGCEGSVCRGGGGLSLQPSQAQAMDRGLGTSGLVNRVID